jgi:hypothetical protein
VSLAAEPSGSPAGAQSVAPLSSQPTTMIIGLTRQNILESTAPPTLMRDLLVIRLRQELSSGTSPHTSEREFRSDLSLLEDLLASQNQKETAARLTPSVSGLPQGAARHTP